MSGPQSVAAADIARIPAARTGREAQVVFVLRAERAEDDPFAAVERDGFSCSAIALATGALSSGKAAAMASGVTGISPRIGSGARSTVYL